MKHGWLTERSIRSQSSLVQQKLLATSFSTHFENIMGGKMVWYASQKWLDSRCVRVLWLISVKISGLLGCTRKARISGEIIYTSYILWAVLFIVEINLFLSLKPSIKMVAIIHENKYIVCNPWQENVSCISGQLIIWWRKVIWEMMALKFSIFIKIITAASCSPAIPVQLHKSMSLLFNNQKLRYHSQNTFLPVHRATMRWSLCIWQG